MFDIRPNENAVDVPPAADAQLRFIGKIHTPFQERKDCPRQGKPDGPKCRIEVFDPWIPSLQGLEMFDAVEVFYWLHQARRDLVTQNPGHKGVETGTFALRSPVRPNPIGLSRVKLISIDGRNVVVRGLDCLNGTPLLDLKPDRCVLADRPLSGA